MCEQGKSGEILQQHSQQHTATNILWLATAS